MQFLLALKKIVQIKDPGDLMRAICSNTCDRCDRRVENKPLYHVGKIEICL